MSLLSQLGKLWTCVSANPNASVASCRLQMITDSLAKGHSKSSHLYWIKARRIFIYT